MKTRKILVYTTIFTLISLTTTLASNQFIGGKIIDGTTGNPLSGASVKVLGTAIETNTDQGGEFTLANLPDGKQTQTLLVEFIGLGRTFREIDTSDRNSTLVDIVIGGELVELNDLVVDGSLMGTARSLNQQKNATSLKNVISSDAVGNFPDQNLAEALGRLPGISVERYRGEGRYVTVRGIDSSLNNYTFDGLAMAAPEDDKRAVMLDVIPSDSLDQIEVSKTFLSDQPGDSIGGSVNIVSPSAFNADGPSMRMTIKHSYAGLRGKGEPSISGLYGKVFGDENQVGILFSFSKSQHSLGTNSKNAEPWELAKDPDSGKEFFFSDEYEIPQYLTKRDRLGLTLNIEYKPGTDSLYYLRGIYNNFEIVNLRNRVQFEADKDGLVSLSESSTTFNVGDEEEYGETVFSVEYSDRSQENTITGYSVGGENRFGDMKIDYKIGYSYAENLWPNRFETTYELKDFTQIRISGLNTRDPIYEYAGTGVDPLDASNYNFKRVEDGYRVYNEDHWELAFNARHDLNSDHNLFYKTGFRIRAKDKRSDEEEFRSKDNPSAVETLDLVSSEKLSENPTFLIPIVDQRIDKIFNEYLSDFAMERRFTDSTIQDWNSTEEVSAAYVMGGFDLGKLNTIGGARIEHTNFDTSGFSIDDDLETAEPINSNNEFSNWLPNIHAKYPLTENSSIRASYTHSVARPGFAQSSASIAFSDDEIERGNPDLLTAESQNIDLSIDYYMPKTLGQISFTVFQKKLDNFVFPRIYEEIIGGQEYEVSTYENGRNGKIKGLELGYSQQLDVLSDYLKGFGFYSNIALIESSAEMPLSVDRIDLADRTVPFPRQSDMVGNLALTYTKKGLFLRAAGTFRSGYLDRFGDSSLEDTYFDDHFQWDFTSRYSFQNGWALFANLINANVATLSESYGISGRLRRNEIYSWTTQIGLRFAK